MFNRSRKMTEKELKNNRELNFRNIMDKRNGRFIKRNLTVTETTSPSFNKQYFPTQRSQNAES